MRARALPVGDNARFVNWARSFDGLLPCRVHYQSHDSWPLTRLFAVALVTANLKLFISVESELLQILDYLFLERLPH